MGRMDLSSPDYDNDHTYHYDHDDDDDHNGDYDRDGNHDDEILKTYLSIFYKTLEHCYLK